MSEKIKISSASGTGKYADVLNPFFAMMEQELHANAGKGDRPGWLSMSPGQCLLEIYYHIGKLQKAVKDGSEAGISEYAADVANMSMMLVDICGLLGDKYSHQNAVPKFLTADQKMQALAYRLYQGAKWHPFTGDYYTSVRADLELYRIALIEGGKVYTEYCTDPGKLSEWDEAGFTSEGFGVHRVHVPGFLLVAAPLPLFD